MAEKPQWVLAMYFDASILRGLPPNLASSDLVRLNRKYNIPRFIPAVAKREWVFLLQEEGRKKYETILANARALGQYLGRDPLAVEQLKIEDLLASIACTQEGILERAGFEEIPTPPVDIETLIDRAIKRVKPFEDKDRGFRDTLIVLSIREHAVRFSGHAILIISNDAVFDTPDVRRQFEEIGVHLLVAKTLPEAVTQLEAKMSEGGKRVLASEAEEIMALLVSRQEEIFAQLREVEVSERFIHGTFSERPAYFGTLQRVRKITPVAITRASLGHVLGGIEERDHRVPVTFHVKVAFDITVAEYPLSTLLSGGTRIRLADAEVVSTSTGVPAEEEILRDITVEREIPVEAWVTMDEHGRYQDLQIEKVRVW